MNRIDIVAALREMGVQGLSRIAGEDDIKWQAVFLMGLAASGKSWYTSKTYLTHTNFKLVDPDEVKRRHPEYDPERPYVLHEWSKEVSDNEFEDVVTNGNGDPVVVDGTGRDAEGIARKMDMAKRNGYRIFLVYVWVPLEVSIFRNRNRQRFVPERKIMDVFDNLERSFIRLKGIADKYRVVINFSSSDLARAKDDVEMYPPPQALRPPRPSDPEYGLARAAGTSCRTRDEDMPEYVDMGVQVMPNDGFEAADKTMEGDMNTTRVAAVAVISEKEQVGIVRSIASAIGYRMNSMPMRIQDAGTSWTISNRKDFMEIYLHFNLDGTVELSAMPLDPDTQEELGSKDGLDGKNLAGLIQATKKLRDDVLRNPLLKHLELEVGFNANDKVARELVSIAKEINAVKFDTRKEMETYKREHKLRPGTKFELRNKQELKKRQQDRKSSSEKELVAGKTGMIVLDKMDFRTVDMWHSILEAVGVPYGEEADFNEVDEVTLRVTRI